MHLRSSYPGSVGCYQGIIAMALPAASPPRIASGAPRATNESCKADASHLDVLQRAAYPLPCERSPGLARKNTILRHVNDEMPTRYDIRQLLPRPRAATQATRQGQKRQRSQRADAAEDALQCAMDRRYRDTDVRPLQMQMTSLKLRHTHVRRKSHKQIIPEWLARTSTQALFGYERLDYFNAMPGYGSGAAITAEYRSPGERDNFAFCDNASRASVARF
jgi:hypothetical protein